MRGRDFFSSLPDEIIVRILSFVPTKSAVQTDILAKRWRHLWKFNPVLDFLCQSPPDYVFLNRCLISLHEAPTLIRKLVIVSESNPNQTDVENWVNFAYAKRVTSFEIYCRSGIWLDSPRELPNSFYDLPENNNKTESLEELVLSAFDFSSPPPPRLPPSAGIKGFLSLQKLALVECALSDEVVGAIMSTCLLLRSLSLRHCSGLVNVKVSGMALKEFVYHERDGVSGETLLELDDALVSLETLNLRVREESLFDWDAMIDRGNVRIILLGQLAAVEVLAANHWFQQFINQEYSRNGNQFTVLKNLKEFYFIGFPTLIEEYNMVMFFAFLEDCPLLQKIQVDFRRNCWDGISKKLVGMPCPPTVRLRGHENQLGRSFLKLQGGEWIPRAGLLHGIKTIELMYFSGHRYEMELAKRFLEKTPSLRALSLCFLHNSGPECCWGQPDLGHEREEIREQVSLFPRASPHAQILIGTLCFGVQ